MRAVRASGLVALALFAALAAWLAPLEPGALALQFAATPRAFGEVVHRWSAQDLQRYRAHLPLDAVLLLASALILRGIRVHERRETPDDARFWRDLMVGLRFVTGHRLLLTLAVLMGVWQMCHYAAMTVQILPTACVDDGFSVSNA